MDETRRRERGRRGEAEGRPRLREDAQPQRPPRTPESVRPPRRPPQPGGVPVPVRQVVGEASAAGAASAGDARELVIDGEDWTVRLAGAGSYGNDAVSPAPLVAVRFFRAGERAARREALLPHGRFAALFDDELRELFRHATELPPATS